MANPPSPPRSLSRVEFEQLLQKAVERHAKDGPRGFSEGELVEAGRELGIDADTVRAVYLEHQRDLARQEQVSRRPVRQRPFDSKLALSEGETFRLTIPPRTGAKVMAVLMPLTLAGMLALVVRGGFPPVVLAITGAFAAIGSLVAIQAARTTRQVVLNRDGSGLLVRQRGGRAKGIPLQAGQVQARLAVREVQTQNSGVSRIPYVALDHGTGTHDLLEGYSHAEQAWVVDAIERWLGR